jgi:Ca2+:H+ antiporter
LLIFDGYADKYRHEARYLAWFDEEGEPSSHNPFKKFRTRRRTLPLGDGISHSKTESDMRTFPERQRRIQGNGDLGGPAESSTLPIEAPGTGRPKTEDSVDESCDLSMNSANGHDLRQRSFRPKKKDSSPTLNEYTGETSRPSDPERDDKQKYTVAGQLKATVLNSWINLLLIFVPAGSNTHLPFAQGPESNVSSCR